MSRWLLPIAVCSLWFLGCEQNEQRVVLYSAQDREFALPIFQQFKETAGIQVAAKFDSEAKKTVGLYTDLINERNRVRCDVFWNNEILSTLRLAKQNMLEMYESPAAENYPPSARARNHTWHAFAERARVLIVNTQLLEGEKPRGLLELTQPRWKDQAVLAMPIYGTSATHAACLFEVLGPEKAKQFYQGLKANGVHIAPGNKQVAEWVGRGRTPTGGKAIVGLTDSDDAIAEVQAGSPVTLVFPDAEAPEDSKMGTLFIPNSLAILKFSPNPKGARKLVDFLLSNAIEKQLAEGGGHQFPMNPTVKAALPAALQPGLKAKRLNTDWDRAATAWDETQTFLRKEFAGP